MDKGLYSQLTLALDANDKRHRQHADQENDFVHIGAWKKNITSIIVTTWEDMFIIEK